MAPNPAAPRPGAEAQTATPVDANSLEAQLSGRFTLQSRERAAALATTLAAWAAGDIVLAEHAALRHLGFEPPTRASGDIQKPLPVDGRYRRLAAAALHLRVRAITGGLATPAPDCCAAVTRATTVDRTGYASLVLPRAPMESIGGADERWLLSPLDPSLGFVPCAYDCAAAISARRSTLDGRSLASLRALTAVGLLRLAPGIDLILTGPQGRGPGAIKLQGLFAVFGAQTPAPLVRLVESLVVRRLLAGAQVRFLDDAVDSRQGLVFVKMLQRTSARWLQFG